MIRQSPCFVLTPNQEVVMANQPDNEMMTAPNRVQYAPLPVWARKQKVQELTGVPDNWLYDFAAEHPESVRKFTAAKNGTLVFNVAAVLEAIQVVGR